MATQSDVEPIQGPQLLKVWNNWSDGVGHIVDDGRTHGMYSSTGLLGLVGELRPAPFFNVSDINEGTSTVKWTYSSDTAGGVVFAVEPDAFGTAVTVQSSGATSGTDTTTNTLTFAHTVDAGTNRGLFLGVAHDVGGGAVTATYDGVSLTFPENNTVAAGTFSMKIAYLAAPNVGTANIVVTWAGAARNTVVGIATTWDNVSQNDPVLPLNTANATTITSTTTATAKPTGAANGIAIGFLATDDQNPTPDAASTELAEDSETIFLNATSTPFVAGGVHYQYFFEEPASSDATIPFLYAIRGRTDTSQPSVFTRKIILANTNFGTVFPGAHLANTGQKLQGQPARYAGEWYIPGKAGVKPIELTTVGTTGISSDTVTSQGVATAVGGDHLGNLGSQLMTAREGSGFAILKIAGTFSTDADWGSFFEVSDLDERPTGLAGMQGLAFVLTKEGLFSFNKNGRAGLVFEDFRSWRTLFDNVHMRPWRGGLLIPHPSGLIWYTNFISRLPLNIGLDRHSSMGATPPSNVTELHGGRYHSVAPVGDFAYGIYQPDVTSTNALVTVGYGNPTNPIWQVLGQTTLQAIDSMLGCHVAVASKPDSSSYVTPTVWFGNGADLSYALLDNRASPFRSRAQTHKVNVSADAFMSEIFFDVPTDISHVVVYTQDMASGDKWQIRGVVDAGDDRRYGHTIISDGRSVRKIDSKDVHRFVLHVNWAATSASNRVAPSIKRIELWGQPKT